uniref:Uncharacterized protein n=1 Tax=Streptomyces avermitilis TaxID=33903 RepID=A0A499V5P1_STRAX|nr:hypothetical protein SAVMC3_03570 [Streptomyces avermitilis]
MILTITLACLIALIFGASGVLNTLALPKARELAAETGFSVAAYRRIGVLQLAGVAGVVLGLAVPPLGGLAGPGFSCCLPELWSCTCARATRLPNSCPPPCARCLSRHTSRPCSPEALPIESTPPRMGSASSRPESR